MVAKLLWLQEQSPEIWRRASKLCLISDYLTLLLTGKHVTEAGAAGLTGLVDIHRCQWYPEMLARFEIDELRLPAIVRAGTDLGPIDPQAAQRFGLPASCRFVVGCLDQYAGAIGAGNVETGMISETTGTVLATVQCADRFAEQLGPAVLQGPAFREGLYWRMAFGEVSANYLEWFREQLPDRPDFDQLIALAEPIEPGAEGLRLRTDVGLSSPEKVFDGLTAHHTRGHHGALHPGGGGLCLERSDGSPVRRLSASRDPLRRRRGPKRPVVADQGRRVGRDHGRNALSRAHEPGCGRAGPCRARAEAEVQTVARQWVRLKPPHRPDPQRHRQYRVLRCKTTT